MTGWTQFTARFEQDRHADAIVEDAEASPHRISYAKSSGNIARVRLLGYDNHENATELLEAAGPLELSLVADFNDTTDSGKVTVYDNNLHAVTTATCPEASRWSFELTVGGLTETGERAGNDFSLQEQYGDSSKAVIPLDEFERIADETLEMMKTEAQVVAEE